MPACPSVLLRHQAYEVLGLPNKDHTFDQILTAKNRQLSANKEDTERQLQVSLCACWRVSCCARVVLLPPLLPSPQGRSNTPAPHP
jgi:hypothetical protein